MVRFHSQLRHRLEKPAAVGGVPALSLVCVLPSLCCAAAADGTESRPSSSAQSHHRSSKQ